MKVVPTINSTSFEEIKNRLKMIEGFDGFIQIDVADGTFTKNTLWHNASDLLQLETDLNIEVHLMINNIEDRIENWLIEPVKRIIFQLEASKDPYFVIKKCRDAGKDVAIAIGPDTPWTQLMPFCGKVDMFQILSVYPGLPSQEFIEDCLEKISDLKNNCPSAIIEVDGGVNKEVAKKCKEAGADLVASASYVFKSDNIKEKIKELEQV